MTLFPIHWLKEGSQDSEEGGATWRKRSGCWRPGGCIPSQNAFVGMWYAQGTNFDCVKALRIWDLSDRVASIILTNTVPPWEILSKHNSSQPWGIETFEWHQVQGYVPWQLPGVQISSVAGKWVGVTVTQGGRKINTLLSKLCHLTRTPAWKESSCISFWR